MKKKAHYSKNSENEIANKNDYDSMTDKIPQKPMSAVEGVSYSAVIIAAFAVFGGSVWAFISNYVIDPIEYKCFDMTLKKLRDDPRITVRLGNNIKGYGEDTNNRWQRQRIPNREYKDPKGLTHLQIQFHIKGSRGMGIVYADLYQDSAHKWNFAYLFVDVPQIGNTSQRLAIINPQI